MTKVRNSIEECNAMRIQIKTALESLSTEIKDDREKYDEAQKTSEFYANKLLWLESFERRLKDILEQ